MKMQRIGKLALACAGALAITACGGDADNGRTYGTPGATGTAGASVDIDRDFISDQLEDGDAEVRLGRLAEERASHADVKAFGRMMVEAHTVAGTDLKRIAGEHNVTADHDDMDEVEGDVERLSRLEGAAFDRAYLDLMVEEHEEAIDELEDKVSDDGDHADVRAWASQVLPKVRQHLERARALRETLDGDTM